MKVYDATEPAMGVKWKIIFPDKIHRLHELRYLLIEHPKDIKEAKFNKFINYYVNEVDFDKEIDFKELKRRYIEWLEKNN